MGRQRQNPDVDPDEEMEIQEDEPLLEDLAELEDTLEQNEEDLIGPGETL